MKPLRGNSPFADDSSVPRNQERPRGRSTQFSLAKLMLILTVATAATAPLAYLVQALRGNRGSHFVFIVLCLAAPTLLLIVVSLTYGLLSWFAARRRR